MTTPKSLLLLVLPLIAACAGRTPPSERTIPAALKRFAAVDTVQFFVQGLPIRRGDVGLIDGNSIAAIHYLVGEAMVEKYGPNAKAVVEIDPKADASPRFISRPEPLFLLDGHEVPASLVSVLDSKRIAEVEVLKGPAATRVYGERAGDGIVVITSKPSGI
jgi:hypothetical protein